MWEAQPSNNPNLTAIHLQQFNGVKWTTVMKVNRKRLPSVPGQVYKSVSPVLQASVASPTRAVVTLIHLLPPPSKSGTVVTHNWNGAKWVQQANATFTTPDQSFWWQQLQALNSGSALRTSSDYYLGFAGGMWRLA